MKKLAAFLSVVAALGAYAAACAADFAEPSAWRLSRHASVTNGILVVDNTIMENYWNRRIPIYPSGQIELQHHGSHLEFRNIYIKELK